MTSCLSLLCFMVFGPPSLGLDSGMMPVQTGLPSVQAFGRQHAACQAWGDGCTICNRNAGEAAQCSTPGIACTPGPVACSAPAP